MIKAQCLLQKSWRCHLYTSTFSKAGLLSQRQVVRHWHLMMQMYFLRPRNYSGKIGNRDDFKAAPCHHPQKRKRQKLFLPKSNSFERITIVSKIQIQQSQGENKNSYSKDLFCFNQNLPSKWQKKISVFLRYHPSIQLPLGYLVCPR